MRNNLHCQKVVQWFPEQEEVKEGDITGEYEATSGSGNFVQSLVCTDGFMENIHTYIFISNHQIECFNRSNFLPFRMSLISQKR